MTDFTAGPMAKGPVGSRALSLPNILTYGRLLIVPLIAACLYVSSSDFARWTAAALFLTASITDWLDGYLARTWSQQSALGRMLDPIADKLLVGVTLMMLVYDGTINGLSVFAAVVILSREILVSGLREFLAELNVKVFVTKLAKWKTALQMLALGVLLIGPAGDHLLAGTSTAGLVLLWLAAVLTLWTGFDYLRAGVRHAMKH